MNNLFKCKLKTYAMQSSQEEVYQQESYYKVIVIDRAGAMEKVGNPNEIIEKLFDAVRNYRIEDAVFKIFGKKHYNFQFKVSGYGNDRIVKVIITKRRWILEKYRCFVEATRK